MIVQEQISETLTRTYSDQGFYIRGGVPEGEYEEAIDLTSLGRTYVETDRKIEVSDDDDDYATAGRILMGVEE